MSQAQRAPFNDAATETYKAAFFAMLESRFGVFDYFWFAIGLATAFRLGAGFEDDEEYLVPDTPLGLPNPGRKGRVEESAKPRVRRKADNDPDEGNNFFRAMRPAEDDDLPSISGAGEARSEAA